MRYFRWSEPTVEEKFFDMMEQLDFEVGLRYSRKLKDKYPDIDQSKAENN